MKLRQQHDQNFLKGIDKGIRSKNLESFLEIIPVQKEVFPLHKLQDHAYEK